MSAVLAVVNDWVFIGVIAFPVLAWAAWFGWNLGLAAAGESPRANWRRLP